MKVLGIIPARGGSKGIPGKNIKMLNGRPLMAYTVDAIQESQKISKVILSSDDESILEVGRSLGLEVPFTRPSDLATDASPTLPVILHTLDFFESQNIHFDAICILQLTSPFRKNGLIDEAIQVMEENTTDSVISVLPVPHEYNPHWVFEPDDTGFLKIATGESEIIPRRQELPNSYFRDGGLYLTRTEVLRNQKSLFGSKIGYVIGDASKHVNLDTMEDWFEAEVLAQKISGTH